MSGLGSARILRATLVRGRVKQRIARKRVKRATRVGRLRLRPGGKLKRCRRHRCKLILRVEVRYKGRRGAPIAAARACSFGSFGVGNWPGSCWRPYSDSSPFNRPLPSSPRLASNSARVVDRVASWGSPDDKLHTNGSDGQTDYEHPYYFSRRSDPKFRVHCAESWGRCAVERKVVRIPNRARPAKGPDAHMAVVDQSGHWEYDFWQVRRKPSGGGRLTISWGGRTRIGTLGASGLGAAGTASGFGLLAGVIRGPEVAALEINHALFMHVKCTSGRVAWPARGTGMLCSQLGSSNSGAPAMGTHFQLAMSDEQIDALGAPPLQTAVLRAMAHYGLFVGDTGGAPWGIQFESDRTYTSFGARPLVRDAFEAQGAQHYRDSEYDRWNLDTVPIDWGRYLRVVAPCVARGTCR